jgi:hypothetical protein
MATMRCTRSSGLKLHLTLGREGGGAPSQGHHDAPHTPSSMALGAPYRATPLLMALATAAAVSTTTALNMDGVTLR